MEYQEKAIERSYDGRLMLRLIGYARTQKLRLIISIVLMLFITGVDLVIPYFTKIAIDDYISPADQSIYLIPADRQTGDAGFSLENGTFVAFPSLAERRAGFFNASAVPENAAGGIIHDAENGDYYLIEGLSKSERLASEGDITISGETAMLSDTGAEYPAVKLTEAQIEAFKTFNKSQLQFLVTVFAVVLLINFVFSFGHTYLLNYASQKIVYSLRETLFSHLQSMDLKFFDRNPVGRLVTRVSNDMENINEMFTNVIVTSLKDFTLLFGTLVVMLVIDVKLTLICMSTMPFVIFAASIFRQKARQVQRAVKIKLAKINATLSENISGMKIIQIFNQEDNVYDAFDDINRDYLKSALDETRVYAVFRPTMNLAYSVSLSLLIWFGGGDAIRGAVELGVLVAFISYTQQFFRPIMDLSEKFNIFQSSMASAERIFLLLDTEERIKNPEHPVDLSVQPFEGHIVFEDVWFSYADDPKTESDYVLKGVSFEVKPGETVALVGATGSGKTTIISLINRFYDIQKGHIYIDGIDIQQLDIQSLRSRIGMVLQDVFLFAGDISSNIRLSNTHISDEKIREIARYVNADDFISRLPKGYSEPVTERGATFSAGQRQLLSFARALAFDPSVLVLDEATSNIDTETEHLIQDVIEKLIRGRTTLIVAHRLSTIQHADVIIVMSRGEIREMGNHQALLEKGGLYYDLYRLQYAER